MRKQLTRVIGGGLLLVGLLGFAPGLSTVDAQGRQLLFGLFMVGAFHNAFHVLSGAAGLLFGGNERATRGYLGLFGLVYGVLALLGLTVGIGRVNLADHILHAVLALVMLAGALGRAPRILHAGPLGGEEAAS